MKTAVMGNLMPTRDTIELANTIEAMRPMVPAKDFETSRRFYEELGFRPQVLNNALHGSGERGIARVAGSASSVESHWVGFIQSGSELQPRW
jgi:hypothetical protein